jgi:hypothetical protein
VQQARESANAVADRARGSQSFAEVLKQVQTMSFDVVVFDTAPTGHTLRLLQLPATLEKSLGKLLSLQNGLGGLFNTFSSMLGGASDVTEESMFSKLQGLKEMVEQVNTQFRDASLTTFVCVACAEFLSLFETYVFAATAAFSTRCSGGNAADCTRFAFAASGWFKSLRATTSMYERRCWSCHERILHLRSRRNHQVHNIIINQVLYAENAGDSPLLAARIRMQQARCTLLVLLCAGSHS